MIERLGTFYARLLGWPVLSRLHLGLFYLSGRALGFLNHASPQASGERLAICTCLRGRTAPVVFDVGANRGNWTSSALACAPDATVHAFEPQTRFAEAIAARHPQVIANAIALGEVAGAIELHDYENLDGSSHASLVPGVIDRIHKGVSRSSLVPVVRLDEYCRGCSVDRIDLLKVDVEGAELQVLRGAGSLITDGRVEAIQFEFNEMNVLSRAFFRDFEELLAPRYDLYRVMPHGFLQLTGRGIWMKEQFVFQNIVALKR